MSRHAKWCPEKGKPPNMSGGYCSTCGEKVKAPSVSPAVEEPQRRSYRLQADAESLCEFPAIVAMHEEQTERAEAEVARLRAEVERLREALTEVAEPSVIDPICREYPSIQKLRAIACAALAGSPSRKEAGSRSQGHVND